MNFKRNVLIFLLLFFFYGISNAQTIQKVKVLIIQFNLNNEFPKVYSDSISISKISNDTTWFNTTKNNPSGKGIYYKAGLKVYRKESRFKTILYYDYSLLKGDTFISYALQYPDTFIVDSVYSKKLNHRSFKAWHLTSIQLKHNGHIKFDWIEGLGELKAGWDHRDYSYIDTGWEIKGMCLNDSVIYWDSAFNYFKERNPSPTCMFDSVSKRLSLEKPVSNDIFNLYPNPASDLLTVSSSSCGTMRIMDYTGKVCLENIIVEPDTQTIDITALKPGVYLVAIKFESIIVYKRICVVRP